MCPIHLLSFSGSVVSDSLQPHGLQHPRLLCPSLSPGVCSNSCSLSQWCSPTISSSSATPFFSCPQSFLHSVSKSRSVVSDSLQPHGLYSLWNSLGHNTGVGSLSLLQWVFPAQGLNPGLPHCGWILYQLNHKGSPSQHQGLFHWVSSSCQVAKALELQHRSFQWIFRVDFL